ncbi:MULTISPECIES: UPF0182 family protein [Crocosphaera]|uniref:UPF0182 protein CWATWH0402_364 n=3 Tax=Crocosphaera watsonii TaxID=263511 RepID=T2JIK7_CROWT|nr:MULTISPECIES: UPF0182 family protein [Crocosphaera]EHJ09836.1 hypothetical protein CWATWH0003_5407 [Crocosphaera watsonii WH 0003]MCH2243250.1 UPF0182 family protein [Crocosphaera sp.]NQZ63225.1 UPF0182 family protein [Crocosphaera sp.]CCQ57815.1 UPF0182 protein alr1037 [Crocosphaera watsonii WH 0005]CCQ64951.1 hypothetical protein CWATWH0402_364 [Crocosphaera watsonii WH 0402]
MFKFFTPSLTKFITFLLGIGLILELVSRVIVERLWFQEVGYVDIFAEQLSWQLGLWVIISGFSWWFLWGNLRQAERHKWHFIPQIPTKNKKRRKPLKQAKPQLIPESPSLGLFWLIVFTISLGCLMGFMLLYYSEVAYNVWTPDFTLPNITPPLPTPFFLDSVAEILSQLRNQLWKAGIMGGIIIVIFVNSQLYFKIISLTFSIIFGLVLSGNWTRILQYFYPTSFGEVDPQFSLDVGFYIFTLSFWRLVNFWLGGLFLVGFILVSLTYLLSANSLSQGKFPGFSRFQLRHLYILGSLLMSVIGLYHWLARYQLLYSTKGVVFGASYTDIHFLLPIYTIASVLAILISLWLLIKGITGWGRYAQIPLLKRSKLKKLPFSPLPFVIYITVIIISFLGQQTVQSFIVEPNELARETPYIERSIALTRHAFGLDKIQIETLNAQGNLTANALNKNRLTINNIRLWDSRPLLQTNRQLQQLRLYYKFNDADIDRYGIPIENDAQLTIESDVKLPKIAKQQVLIAARELDYNEVPEQAKTWVNQHLVYTHGYGFTLSPVNRVAQGGLPFYFVQNIGTENNAGDLQTSSNAIRDNIPIDNPRIYFGESTDTYIMTNTEVKELDYPSGQDNVYNVYNGSGGIELKNWTRRLLFANYLKDWQMIFTRNFTPDTKLIFRRNINRRIRTLAPFLRFDRDPYLVTAEIKNKSEETSLYWIIDAYTTSNRYPYSEPGDRPFNYIRNSVKIVIDAYNGDVNFYIVDPSDPLIQTWRKIFPTLFKPLSEMPISLRVHIRYPKDLYNTQSERLLTYHMTDPQVFYNREDQWRIPQEIYGENQQPIEPYYLLMSLTSEAQEFILFSVYTPTSRNNLIAGLFARSDGDNYGKMLLLELPKQRVIYGPEQIEALINQDPVISQQISLWNRQGSRVIQGNLLVIPFFAEQSLLYVEPLYLEAEQNSLPTLARVIVAYENQIVMSETLDEALTSIFEPEKGDSSTIIRELDPEEQIIIPN